MINANTSEIILNEVDKLSVFLYLYNPPKLRLNYKICYFNKNDSAVKQFDVKVSDFFYQGTFEKGNDSLRLGIMLNKYDSVTKKEEIIIKYLKSIYP